MYNNTYQQGVPSLYAANVQAPVVYQQQVNQQVMTPVEMYAAKSNIDYSIEIASTQAKAEIDIYRYNQKRRIDLEALSEIESVKADIRTKSSLLTDKIYLTDSGEIVQTQEFLLEEKKSYSVCNYNLVKAPVLYVTTHRMVEVLELTFRIENRSEFVLFLRTDIDDVNFYRKKFRNAGVAFKIKRTLGNRFYWDLLERLRQSANEVFIPENRGFYTYGDKLHYAGKQVTLWREVVQLGS